MGSIFGNYGLRRVMDQQLRFLRPAEDAYGALRVSNTTVTPATQQFSQMGFEFTPTASGGPAVGFTDLRIDPPPVAIMLSMHNVAMAQSAGFALRAGARDVFISNTWVEQRQLEMGYVEGRQVFEDPSVIGIVVNRVIVSVMSILPDYAFGRVVGWHIYGSANELR